MFEFLPKFSTSPLSLFSTTPSSSSPSSPSSLSSSTSSSPTLLTPSSTPDPTSKSEEISVPDALAALARARDSELWNTERRANIQACWSWIQLSNQVPPPGCAVWAVNGAAQLGRTAHIEGALEDMMRDWNLPCTSAANRFVWQST